MVQPEHFSDADGAAAIGICESLLIALIDLKVISEQAVHDLLEDVASTHAAIAAVSPFSEKHMAVVRTVKRLQFGKAKASAGE
jgi:hypothetical protein